MCCGSKSGGGGSGLGSCDDSGDASVTGNRGGRCGASADASLI